MSDTIVYGSEAELRERLQQTEDTLADIKLCQQANEEQRSVLAEQVQGAQAVSEQDVREYEQRCDELDRQQADLRALEEDFVKSREVLLLQLDAKRDAKLGKRSVAVDDSKAKKAQQTAAAPQPLLPTTKAQVEQLMAQKTKPMTKLTYDPPGGISQAAQIDRDLKLDLKARKKQERLDDASLNMRANWNRSSSPKR